MHRQTHIVHRDINKSTETHSRYIEIYLQTQTYIGTYMHRHTYINNLTPGLSIKRDFFFWQQSIDEHTHTHTQKKRYVGARQDKVY